MRNWGLDNVQNMESDAFAYSLTLVCAPPPRFIAYIAQDHVINLGDVA